MLTLNTYTDHATPAMIMKIVQQTDGTYDVDKKVPISDARVASKFIGCVVMNDSRIVVALQYMFFILNDNLDTIHKTYP